MNTDKHGCGNRAYVACCTAAALLPATTPSSPKKQKSRNEDAKGRPERGRPQRGRQDRRRCVATPTFCILCFCILHFAFPPFLACAIANPPSATQDNIPPRPPSIRYANPAVERFNRSITFLATFDQGTPHAELAGGSGKPVGGAEGATFADGLFGRALKTGRLQFSAAGNLDTTRSGSIVAWIAPHQWQRADTEPYLFPLMVHFAGGKFMLGRQGRSVKPKRSDMVYGHVAVGDSAASVRVGSSARWTDGSWRLVVITWRPGAFEVSLDGGPLRRKPIERLGKAQWIALGLASARPGMQLLVDEVMVLDRPLAQEEIDWMNAAVRKAAAKAAALDGP